MSSDALFHWIAINSLCSDSIKIFRNTKESADAINRIYKNIPTTQTPYLLTLELVDILYKLTESDIVQLDKDIIKKDISENHDSDMQRNEILDYFINKCYMYKLTPAVLAEELHISERQITRIIQKKYGEPFHKVLLAKRIMVAEQMLIKSDIRIQDIALSVGFHSPDILYKEFKKKHNMTPGEFRTNYNTMVSEK